MAIDPWMVVKQLHKLLHLRTAVKGELTKKISKAVLSIIYKYAVQPLSSMSVNQSVCCTTSIYKCVWYGHYLTVWPYNDYLLQHV